MAFNCPPKFNNQKKKAPKMNRFNKYNKKSRDDKGNKEKETAAVAKVEFAGYVGENNKNKKSHQTTESCGLKIHKELKIMRDCKHYNRKSDKLHHRHKLQHLSRKRMSNRNQAITDYQNDSAKYKRRLTMMTLRKKLIKDCS